jgi:hypothetical protein
LASAECRRARQLPRRRVLPRHPYTARNASARRRLLRQAIRALSPGTIASQFEFVTFDTSQALFGQDRAALEIPISYRHTQTGESLETTLVNFWTFEDGWPIRLAENHDLARIQDFVSRAAKRETA